MKQRALAEPGNNIGQRRSELYAAAFERITQALNDGYYLEAIGLEESLLSDRLESYVSFVKGSDFGFKNLGRLISEMSSLDPSQVDQQLLGIVKNEVDPWRNERNRASHEMVKIDANSPHQSWDDRMGENKKAATDGLPLVRKVDKRLRQLRP